MTTQIATALNTKWIRRMIDPARAQDQQVSIATAHEQRDLFETNAPMMASNQLDTSPTLLSDGPHMEYLVSFWDLCPKGKAYNSVSETAYTHKKIYRYRDTDFQVDLQPAQIETLIDKETKTYKTMFYFPTVREDIVCEVIRYLCHRDSRRFVVEDKFTFIYEIQINDIFLELKRRKQQYSHKQIVESLEILHKCHLSFVPMGGSEKIGSTILPIFAYKKNNKPGRKAKGESVCRISFHVIYQLGLLSSNFRPALVDPRIKTALGRHCFKILSMNFINAGYDTRTGSDAIFHLDVTTTLNSSIIEPGKNLSQNKAKIKKALLELEKLGHITKPQFVDEKYQGKIDSCTAKIIATEFFAAKMKRANSILKTQNGAMARRQVKDLLKKDT